LAWPAGSENEYKLVHLASVKSRTEGVEEALVLLVLAYLHKKGATSVQIEVGDKPERVAML
jgi:hypothetical protein